MDFLRFPYQTDMRIVAGQAGVPAKWFKCAPGRDKKPAGVGWGSRIWEEEWRTRLDIGEFGEILGVKPAWLPSPQPAFNECDHGPYWPERFRPGVPVKDADTFPVLRRDAQGWPIACCHPAQFVPLTSTCSPSVRIPDAFWFETYETGGLPCTKSLPTKVSCVKGLDGIWFGTSIWGSTGLPVEVRYDPAQAVGGLCPVGVHFPHPPWPLIEGFGVQLPGAIVGLLPIRYSLNPLLIEWEFVPTGIHGAAICDWGPFSPRTLGLRMYPLL